LLPFNSDRQAKRVRQDAGLTEGAWKSRQQAIRADHRAEGARAALAQAWKERLQSKGDGAAAAGPAKSAAKAVPDGEVQYEDD